jgi:hypothetical protein
MKKKMIKIKTNVGVIEVPAETPKDQIKSIQNNFNNGATAQVLKYMKRSHGSTTTDAV